jgi:hypothetical protein
VKGFERVSEVKVYTVLRQKSVCSISEVRRAIFVAIAGHIGVVALGQIRHH